MRYWTSVLNRRKEKQSFPLKSYGMDVLTRLREIMYGPEGYHEQKSVGPATNNHEITYLHAMPSSPEYFDLHGIMLSRREDNISRSQSNLIYLGRFTTPTARILRSAFKDFNVVAAQTIDVDAKPETVTWEQFIDDHAASEKSAAQFDFVR